MKILVCGGRAFVNVALLWRKLDKLDAQGAGISLVIDGASDDVTGPYLGADYWANQWGLARGKPVSRYHAKWKIEGRAAGPIRNARMLADAKPDIVVAFDGGRGTANMIGLAQKFGVRVIEVAE